MANRELVIKIPEEIYNYVKKQVAEGIDNPLKVYIANGIPLPKGHGRLIDADEVEELDERLCATECGCCTLDGCFYDEAKTIIDADRSEGE